MADEVLEFLVSSGGGPVDEVVARVGVRPHNIADSLTRNVEQGNVVFEGPKTAADFSALVDRVRTANDYENEDKTQQRIGVLEEITNNERAFRETIVRPTSRAFRLTLL
jgi:hypothetical protein